MIRLAHVSDIHLTCPTPDWMLRDWFCRRLASWVNLRYLGRGKRFVQGAQIVDCLMRELPQREIDHIVFSGDATSLGFGSEMRLAAEALRVGALPIPGLAIPGNHDYGTRHSAASGDFERCFGAWQQGRRIGEHLYPFAQPVGPLWLVAVNSASGNRWLWDAGGNVGGEQLARLRQLLAELEPGPRILVTHYPICLADTRREPWYRGLRDLDALLDVARAGGVALWLHGHRHTPYHFQTPPSAPFPVICAGSATQTGKWSYGEYAIDGQRLHALRRAYDPALKAFQDVEEFTLQLAAPS